MVRIKRRNKLKNKIKKFLTIANLVQVVLGVIVGIAMVAFGEKISKDKEISLLTLLLSFCFLIISFFIHVVIHEVGHFVFGKLSGYRFSSFRIGNIAILSNNNSLSLKKYHIPQTAGQCLMIPPSKQPIPYTLYLLGGVLFNVLFSLVALLLNSDNPILSLFNFQFIAMGFVTALLNGLPLKLAMIENDGYTIQQLHKSERTRDCFLVQLLIQEKTQEGVRLKDMPQEWFNVDIVESNNGIEAAINYASVIYLLDKKEIVQAIELMDKLIEKDRKMIGFHRNLLIAERIFCEIIENKELALIEPLLTDDFKKFAKAMKTFPSMIRMQYALYTIKDKNSDLANKTLVQFEKVAKNYPYKQDIEGERELLLLVKEN